MILKLPRIKLNKLAGIKDFFKKLPRFLGANAFLVSLGLISLSLIIAGSIFYQYSFLVLQKEPGNPEKPLYFQEKVFQDILKIWDDRQRRFEETDFKEYPDLFRSKVD